MRSVLLSLSSNNQLQQKAIQKRFVLFLGVEKLVETVKNLLIERISIKLGEKTDNISVFKFISNLRTSLQLLVFLSHERWRQLDVASKLELRDTTRFSLQKGTNFKEIQSQFQEVYLIFEL